MKMKLLVSAVSAACAMMSYGDWKQTQPGTYYYDEAANWTDGKPNGVIVGNFTGDQTIVFRENTTIETLDIRYGNQRNLTFLAEGSVTLTIKGINYAPGKGSVTLTIGSEDGQGNFNICSPEGECLTVSVNNGSRMIRSYCDVLCDSASFSGSTIELCGKLSLRTAAEASPAVAVTTGTLNLIGGLGNGLTYTDVAWSGKGTLGYYDDVTFETGAFDVGTFTAINFYGKVTAPSLMKTGNGNVRFYKQIELTESPHMMNFAGNLTTIGVDCQLPGGDLEIAGSGPVDIRCPIDLGGKACVYTFSNTKDQTVIYGVISNGTLVKAGTRKMTLRGEVAPDATIELRSGSLVVATLLEEASDLPVVVNGGALEILDTDDNDVGGMPNRDFLVTNGATMKLSANKGRGGVRARNITIDRAILQISGNTTYPVTNTISGKVIFKGDQGWASSLRVSSNTGKGVAFVAEGLETCVPSVARIEGPGLGQPYGANAGNIYLKTLPTLIGGAGEPGTTTMSVVPQLIGGSSSLDGAQPAAEGQSFVTYDPVNGLRPLDLDTEYVKGLPTDDVANHNILVSLANPGVLAKNLSVNSLLIQSTGVSATDDLLKLGDGVASDVKLKVLSGQVLSGARGAGGVVISAPLDFADQRLCFTYGAVNHTQIASPLYGTGGAIFCQPFFTYPNTRRYASFSGEGVLSGEVYALSDMTLSAETLFPHGVERPGSLNIIGTGFFHVVGTDHGKTKVYKTCYLNSINGDGGFGNDKYQIILYLGGDNANGALTGAIRGVTFIEKSGTGTQYFGGEVSVNDSFNVHAGGIVIDGEMTKGAVTVAQSAAFSGSGAITGLVTLDAGAKLGAGSVKVDDQVLNLNGGLTLAGDATLDILRQDSEHLASVAIAGATTIPEAAKITVNIGAGQMKQNRKHVLLTSETDLMLANFKRGENCGPLSLSDDSKQLLMTVSNGLVVILR